MIGYVSLNEEKAAKHFSSIKMMLESPLLLADYPECKPKVQKLRDVAESWSRDALVTVSDAMIVPLTLLGSSRGWKSATGARFDAFILDDIDALGQSVEFTRKLIETLKGEILAAGDDNTVVMMPQNLIYRDSICTQIYDHRADILSDRIFRGPYPLLKWYEAEKRDLEDGAKQWVITGGEIYDEAIPIEYAEKLLNKFGKATFDRECQQLVFEVEDDKDFREWSEPHHIITHSEFIAQMDGDNIWNEKRKCLQIPPRWNVGLGFDWGTTKKHPSAIVFIARPNALSRWKDYHFVFGEVVLPEYPLDAFELPELVSPGRVARAITDFLKKWNISESQITHRLMSHEASAAMNTMAIDLKDDIAQFFGKWKAKRGSGVPQMQNLLELDYRKEHPFRKMPIGTKINGNDVGGQPLMGCPRIFFLVEDAQGRLTADANGRMLVAGALNSEGLARGRFEMPLYSHKNTGQGKIDDDWVDAARGLLNLFGIEASPMTQVEEFGLRFAAATPFANDFNDNSEVAQINRSYQAGKILRQMELEGWDGGNDEEEEDEDEKNDNFIGNTVPEFMEVDISGGY